MSTTIQTTTSGTPKLSSNCRTMNVCGINILGNPESGAFIGLDNEGETLINALANNAELVPERLTQNQTMLLQALAESGCFEGQQISKKLCGTYLHVTSRCNLNCAGCYSEERNRNAKSDMTLKEMTHVLNNLAAAGVSRLTISGGEPFMRDDIIEIIKHAKQTGMEIVACISNGIAPLKTYLEAGKYLDRLAFSLDSHDKASAIIRPANVFNVVIEKIKALKKAGINTAIVFTLHKRNYHTMSEMVALAAELDVPFNFSLFSVLEYGATKSDLVFRESDLEEIMLSSSGQKNSNVETFDSSIQCKWLCGAGRTTVSISSNGGVYPCHMFNGNDDFLMGNALDHEISSLLKSDKNTFGHMTVDDLRGCEGCNVKYLCGGGCRFRGYAVAGDAKGHDITCTMHYARVVESIAGMISQQCSQIPA
ncbi:MAG: radical SAM protein [Defluviitaleaceae bacterium]|nr:radical SAM protein [Defluviitaleaceae bacterium]